MLAVTATLKANSVANGSTTKLGCRLNGRGEPREVEREQEPLDPLGEGGEEPGDEPLPGVPPRGIAVASATIFSLRCHQRIGIGNGVPPGFSRAVPVVVGDVGTLHFVGDSGEARGHRRVAAVIG